MQCGKSVRAVLVALWGVGAIACGVSLRAQTEFRSEVELTTREIDSRENALGGLVADAIREVAQADAAFIAASSFTEISPLPRGNVSIESVLKALDFRSDNVLVVKLTGQQIVRALEHGLYLYPKPNSGFLQFSGLTVTIHPEAEKEGRVVSVKVGGSPLEPGRTYRVAMPAPLANGALAYFKIWKKSDIETDTKITLEEAVTRHLRMRKTVTRGDERLIVLKNK
ncbi:MAG: 5'-nucleotidase [Chloroherpetonaceae bacterium]|nr:5'-nucleotidase C-terminal domain-containing protein [Chthonomonadaceae bacterium]MDW8207891.1 5'-nucleotidase [Chloroherpetonaceae bacterium]